MTPEGIPSGVSFVDIGLRLIVILGGISRRRSQNAAFSQCHMFLTAQKSLNLVRPLNCRRPEEAKEYADLKATLAEEHQGIRAQYTPGKADFIEGILGKAKRTGREDHR